MTTTKRIDGQEYVVCEDCDMRILRTEYEQLPHFSWCPQYKTWRVR